MKRKLTELTIFGDFNISLAKMHRKRQKINKDIEDLNTINQTDQLGSLEHAIRAKYSFFSRANGDLYNVDHILGHRASSHTFLFNPHPKICFDFERERRGERETHRLCVPTGHGTWNLAMCPDQKWKLQAFLVYRTMPPPTEPPATSSLSTFKKTKITQRISSNHNKIK